MNRLSRFCDGLIEASWLLALIVVPLYFSHDTSRIFDFINVVTFRTLVTIALAAWGVKLISTGGILYQRLPRPASLREFLRQPFVLPVIVLAFSYIISTAFSISTHTSLKGTYERNQGIYTLLSYILFFVILAGNLRRREQIDRIIAVLASVSFVVDIYAIIQRAGLDPFSWGLVVTERSISTIGQHIFTGAFLSMTLILMLGRIILAIQSGRNTPEIRSTEFLKAGVYTAISLLNLVAIWLTGSRGPLIGLFFGLSFFGLLILAYWRLRRVVFVFLGLALVAVIFVGVLNLPGGPLENLRDTSPFKTFGHLLDPGTGTGRTRALIWNGVSRLVRPHAPLTFPDGSTDRWNILRPLIGYGPETIRLVFEDYYDIETFILEGRDLLTDRSHNEFWDMLAFFGLLGMLAEYWLFITIIYFALKWMGFIASVMERNLYWGLTLTGSILGAIGLSLFLGIGFLGLGIPIGLLVGPFGLLLYHCFRSPNATLLQSQLTPWHMLILASLLSSIISHYVETLFGIAVPSTRTLFWLSAALVLIIGWIMPAMKGQPVSSESKRADELRQISVHASLILGILLILGTDFIANVQNSQDAVSIFIDSLSTIVSPARQNSLAIFAMLLGTLLVTGLLLQLESDSLHGRRPSWGKLAFTQLLCLFISALAWFWRASQLAMISQASNDLPNLLFQVSALLSSFYIMLFLVLLILSFALASGRTAHPIPRTFPALASYLILPIIAIVVSILFNIRPVYADMLSMHAQDALENKRFDNALELYQSILEISPSEDFYWRKASFAAAALANSQANETQRENLYQLSEDYLLQGFDLEPLYIQNIISLARFYRQWGGLTSNPGLRSIRFIEANRYFAAALDGRPNRVELWLDWAELRFQMGDLQDARRKIDAALATDNSFAPLHSFSGKLYFAEAEIQDDPSIRTQLLQKAILEFQIQIGLLEKKGENTALALFDLGNVYTALGQYEQARTAYSQAVQMNLGPYQWMVYQKLAEISGKLNESLAQREYLKQAIAVAPTDQVPPLQEQLEALAP